MPTLTSHYGLVLYNNLSPDIDANFQTYRNNLNGISTSNMSIIDDALYAHDVKFVNLTNGFVYLLANATGTNTYEKTSLASFDSYFTGECILLGVDINNSGASTLNINSLGTRPVRKLDTGGSVVELVSGDLKTGILYPFAYYSTDEWVLLSAVSSGSSGGTTDVLMTQVFS